MSNDPLSPFYNLSDSFDNRMDNTHKPKYVWDRGIAREVHPPYVLVEDQPESKFVTEHELRNPPPYPYGGPARLIPVSSRKATRIGFKILDNGMSLPTQAHEGDAGWDIRSRVNRRIEPGQTAAIPTGLAAEIPPGWEIQIRPRSGLAGKHGLIIPNAPGTIDAGYRNEILVLLHNISGVPYDVKRFDRIAQLVFARVAAVEIVEVTQLSETERGMGGFGSTGR